MSRADQCDTGRTGIKVATLMFTVQIATTIFFERVAAPRDARVLW